MDRSPIVWLSTLVLALSGCGNPPSVREPCSTCIESRVVLKVGAIEGPLALVESRAVAVDSLDRIWVSQGATITVLSAQGEFIDQVGGAGDGPGELRSALALLALPGGSVIAFDSDRLRAVEFSADLQFQREWPIRAPVYDALLLSPTEIAVSSPTPASPVSFALAEIIDLRSGDLVEVIGGPAPFRTGPFPRVSLARQDDVLILAHRARLSLEMIRLPSFEAIGEEVHSRSFLDRAEDPRPLANGSPPQSFAQSVSFDAEGRAWVLFWVPASDWPEQIVVESSGLIKVPEGNSGIYDTMIEVLSPGRREVLARGRLPLAINRMWPDGRAFAWSVDELGVPELSILEVSLTEPRGAS